MKRIRCDGKKTHAIDAVSDNGTKRMFCGLRQQKPFHKASHYPCCFGDWKETDSPVTCKSCLRTMNAKEFNEATEWSNIPAITTEERGAK